MAMYYSSSEKGFFITEIHGTNIPEDSVEISPTLHASLLKEQQNGKAIIPGPDGLPISADIPKSAPTNCTPTQGLVALFALKQITEDHVLEAIAQIPDPVQQYTAKIGYQRATTWERGSPTMMAMAQLLQLSEEELDELFTYAVGVQI